MDFLVGLEGADYVLLAADCSQARSIVVMKHDMDKGCTLSENTHMLTSGPVGDQVNFGELIQKNIKLNQLRNGTVASPWSNANFVRHQLATSLRSRNSYNVNLLIGGYAKESDEHPGPQLYFMDYLSAMARVPYGAQGYGGYFTLSLLDKHYKPGLSLEEGKDLLKRCIQEVQKRFMVSMPKFIVRVIDKDGVRVIEL